MQYLLLGESMKFSAMVKCLRHAAMAAAIGSTMFFNTQAFAVNVNTASFEVLQNVKGIGPTRAKAIIEERDRNGAYVNGDDLSARVRGIGDKTLEKMTLSGLTFDGTEPMTRAKSAKMK
jgi:competence protein ComEA